VITEPTVTPGKEEKSMQDKSHWESVYTHKAAEAVSWFQPHADSSIALIRQTGIALDEAIIDVGGGASTMVDDLLAARYSDVTVLDISAAALNVARHRLGDIAGAVHWLEADITQVEFPKHRFDLWHDRAVFHFLTDAADRASYLRAVVHAVKPGGFVIVGTFAEDGPEKCSGLPVMRYSADSLHDEFGAEFELLGQTKEDHHTPFGTVQKFLYCYCRKLG
jgi:ubiquinone/menaquinone biosynthesis C-methylase UbiE